MSFLSENNEVCARKVSCFINACLFTVRLLTPSFIVISGTYKPKKVVRKNELL